MKILIVEDEDRMARLLRRGLQEEGHQADVCATADEAAQQALDIPYDAILLDWMLADKDGVSLLRGFVTARTLRWINYVAGGVIVVFGVLAILRGAGTL